MAIPQSWTNFENALAALNPPRAFEAIKGSTDRNATITAVLGPGVFQLDRDEINTEWERRVAAPPQGEDVTDKTRMSWVEPIAPTPSIIGLQAVVNAPFSPRIPLKQSDYEIVQSILSTACLDRFFVLDNDQHCHNAFWKVWTICLSEVGVGVTEDSHHTMWDLPVVPLLRYYNIRWNRNTNDQTSTGLQRPDFVVYIKNQALMRGEEKPNNQSFGDPHQELKDKLEWTYQGLPYLFGWAIQGSTVLLYAIESDKKTTPIGSYDLDSADGRLNWTNAIRNMIRISYTLVSDITNPSETTTLSWMNLNGRWMDVDGNAQHVVKKWPYGKGFTEEDGNKLKQRLIRTYELIHQHSVPNCDSAKDTHNWKKQNNSKTGPYLRTITSPIGLPLNDVRLNHDELVTCAKDILLALKGLHKIGIIHRDVRLSNIICCNGRYILIDFEDAQLPNEKIKKGKNKGKEKLGTGGYRRDLSTTNHDPAINAVPCLPSVDIWAVGKLFMDFGYPAVLANFVASLADIDPSNRPSAGEALVLLQQFFP